MFFLGDLHEVIDVHAQFGNVGEFVFQFLNDGSDRSLSIDQPASPAGTVIELDHAFGVQQHIAVLGRLELEAIALTPLGDLVAKCQAFRVRIVFVSMNVHSAIPLCQTLWSVTL